MTRTLLAAVLRAVLPQTSVRPGHWEQTKQLLTSSKFELIYNLYKVYTNKYGKETRIQEKVQTKREY